jgi:ABC-type oligopeptide transport system ATPase subunit
MTTIEPAVGWPTPARRIARALINQPRLVICDLPISALTVGAVAVLNLLEDLRRDRA